MGLLLDGIKVHGNNLSSAVLLSLKPVDWPSGIRIPGMHNIIKSLRLMHSFIEVTRVSNQNPALNLWFQSIDELVKRF